MECGRNIHSNAKEPSGSTADTRGYNLGASVIWLTDETFNVMPEVVWNSFETVQPGGSKVRDTTFFVNPSVWFARNYKFGLQVVPGLSFPIGIGSSHVNTERCCIFPLNIRCSK